MNPPDKNAASVMNEARPSHAPCGCGIGETAPAERRKAAGVDPGLRDQNLKRLRRIEGQVRGIHRMVEEDRYCADILTQISSVQQALRSVGKELMRNHLRHCVSGAIRSSEKEAEAMYDEILELMYRNLR